MNPKINRTLPKIPYPENTLPDSKKTLKDYYEL